MRNYEIMFIVNPNTLEDEIDKVNSQLEHRTAGGGKVSSRDGQAETGLYDRQVP
jgi:ribosomal protein S6